VKRGNRNGEKDAAKFNEACAQIIPHLPALLDLCRPEEQQLLLLSHVCKMLIEYAAENPQTQAVVNAKSLSQVLRRIIEGQAPVDTTKYCVDALRALSRCFDEVKATFLDLANTSRIRCEELLRPEALAEHGHTEELKAIMRRFVVLSERGIDMSFGKHELRDQLVTLLRSRAAWMREWQLASNKAEGEADAADAGEESATRAGGEAHAGADDAVGAPVAPPMTPVVHLPAAAGHTGRTPGGSAPQGGDHHSVVAGSDCLLGRDKS